MNRIDRLSAILTQLQSKRLMTAQTIADRFEISLRTVYRDIRALEEAGIPVIGEAGLGYSLIEGYRLPPVMFSKEEALALLVAEKIVLTVSDQHNSRQIQSAMYKVKAILKNSDKDVLADIDENIAIRPPRKPLTENKISNLIQAILNSIADQQIIHIHYTTLGKEESTTRNIEPVGIYFSNEQWYLIAFCQLRAAYRTFRVDQISALRQTGEKFAQQHPSLKDYLAKIIRKEKLIKVVLQIDKSIARFLKQEKYNQGFVYETDLEEQTEMVFMVSSIYAIARWIMTMADHVLVLEPQNLQDQVVQMARRLLSRHQNS
jgi:predicted DNA-binding transcriptional regulator YafY